jgi:hypothetical protein
VSNAFWFVREAQEDEFVKVTSIPTKAQLADFLTKPLNRPDFSLVVGMTSMADVPHASGVVNTVMISAFHENDLMDELFGCDCAKACSCGK